jgi:hypothetical protein
MHREWNPWHPKAVPSASSATAFPNARQSAPSAPALPVQIIDPVFTLHIGDPYSKAVDLYGEVSHQKNGYRHWSRKEFDLTVVVDENLKIRHLWVLSKPGSTLCTQDGLCLGRDTFETFTIKTNRAGMKFDEGLATGEGHTILVEGRANSLVGKDEERVEYTWNIDEGDMVDGKPFEVSEDQLSNRLFTHVSMTSYSLDSTDPKYKDRPEAPGEENAEGG